MSIFYEVKVLPGMHIADAAKVLVAAADEYGAAWMKFNDVPIACKSGADWNEIVAAYDAERQKRAAEYRASAEGQAEEAARVAKINFLQGKHDALIAILPTINFSDDDEVLRWLSRMREATDYYGVKVDRPAIVGAFMSRGYVPNANIGADFNGDDRDNFFRYLVGQALDGLNEVGSIHPMFDAMVADWRKKFLATLPPRTEPDHHTARPVTQGA